MADSIDKGIPLMERRTDTPRYVELDSLIQHIKNENWTLDGVMRYLERDCPTVDVDKVIRCKECMHSRLIDRSKSPEKYYRADCIVCTCEDVVGDEPMIYLNTHYCGYGKSKLPWQEGDTDE